MSKKMIILLFILAAAIVLGWGAWVLLSRHPADYTEAILSIQPTSTVEKATSTPVPTAPNSLALNGHVFYLDLADTMAKRSQGLSGREKLSDNQGMLFLFPYSSKQSFWMHGMNFPLDIVWIAGDRIADISENVPAPLPGQSDLTLPQYAPSVPVDKVLEINAGLAARYGFKIGDKVTLSLSAQGELR